MNPLDGKSLVEVCREVVRAWQDSRILAVYLYGSTVRGNTRPDSDLDVAILDSAERISRVDEARFMDSLERVVHRPVDLRMIRDCSLSHQAHVFQQGTLIWTVNEHAVKSYWDGLLAAYTDEVQLSQRHWQSFLERLADTAGAKR